MRRFTLFLIVIVLVSGGCARGIGPRRVPVDRTAYIEALGDSWKEQLLFNIVKTRYGDTPTFLDISGIQQAYTLSTTGSVNYNVGWGQTTKSETTGTTVNMGGGGSQTISTARALPFFPGQSLGASIGGTRSSQPTITFTPIAGEVLKNTIFTKLSPTKIMNALKAGWQPDLIIPYCVVSMNNVEKISENMSKLANVWDELASKKAIFFTEEEPKDATENEEVKSKTQKIRVKNKDVKPKPNPWDKFAENLVEFTGNLVKKQKDEKGKEKSFFINLVKKDMLDSNNPRDRELLKKIREFREILSLDENLDKYEVVSGPPIKKKPYDKIYINSRSPYQILTLLAQYIDIPLSHENPPGSEPWVWPGKKDQQWYDIPHFHVRVMTGWRRPDEFAAIKYQGYWFYIPNTDMDTKRVFSGLLAIFAMMEVPPGQTPILTLPVR